MVPHGMVSYGMVSYGMVSHGMVSHGMVSHGMVSHGMVSNYATTPVRTIQLTLRCPVSSRRRLLLEKAETTRHMQILEQLKTSGLDALATLFPVLLYAAMQTERQNHVGVAPYERTAECTSHANGPFVVAAYWDGVQFPADEQAEARLSPPVHAGVALGLVRVHGRGGLPGVSRARQERGQAGAGQRTGP